MICGVKKVSRVINYNANFVPKCLTLVLYLNLSVLASLAAK